MPITRPTDLEVNKINDQAATRRRDSNRQRLMEMVMFMRRHGITIEQLTVFYQEIQAKKEAKNGKQAEESRTAWTK